MTSRDVESERVDDGHVDWDVACSGACCIVTENDTEDPVERVYDDPAAPDSVGDGCDGGKRCSPWKRRSPFSQSRHCREFCA